MITTLPRKKRRLTPSPVGLAVPLHLDDELFKAGYDHGLQSNQLTNFKASFRAGFRSAKQELRETRRREGILTFPARGRLVLR